MDINEARLKKETDILNNIARMARLTILVSLCLILLGSCARRPTRPAKFADTSIFDTPPKKEEPKKSIILKIAVIGATSIGWMNYAHMHINH